MSTPPIPLPPFELANRVGAISDEADPWWRYEDLGRRARRNILELLPRGWSFEGKRVYDFGCGAGRTLRHFFAEAGQSEFYGSDIDEASIEWLQQHLCPPFRVFVNGTEPPLPLETDSIDLVYAISVFTHLSDTWSAWLLELHRVLAPDGLAMLTFIGPGGSKWITSEPWDDERIGMNVLRPGQSWDLGGPMVLHSEWWIRAHWGRAFDVLEVRTSGVGSDPPEGQGVALLRKRDVRLTIADLEQPEPGEPRELTAAQHFARQLADEVVELRREREHLSAAWTGEHAARELLERELADTKELLEGVSSSTSWRMTAPLRAAGAAVRKLAGRS